MKEKISLAGDLGSGKSTVSDILIEAIGAEYYSTGKIVRSIAEKFGMTVVELNKYMETHPEIDHEIDDGLKALSELDKALIIDSRMAWHFTKGTFKVYLSCDALTSAVRIMCAKREGERSETLEEAKTATLARRESEKKRYLEQYGVDIKDLSNYSLVVDTSYATPKQIADCIKDSFSEWKNDKTFKKVFISAQRLNYPDTPADEELLAAMNLRLELGDEPDEIRVSEKDGEFYLISGLESALAYSLTDCPFVPATLVKDEPEGEFVKMKNSL